MEIAILATFGVLLALQQILHSREREKLERALYRLAEMDRLPHPDLELAMRQSERMIAQNDRLCQRIQAPEYAVVEHAQAQPLGPLPQTVEMDDDSAHWESRDEMAQRLYDEEVERQQANQAMTSTADLA